MEPNFASHLDALAGWRQGLDRQAAEFARFLAEQELLDPTAAQTIDAVRQRLASDRLVVAFVAEFSRGKSELINAIFFADTGRRILPATPGRTTMCPVELGYESSEPPALALLPIDTRLQAVSLAELRQRPEAWTRIPLDASSPDRLADALTEVKRTKAVAIAEARALGFWKDDAAEDNPPLVAEGLVEVPAWRHAAINYPHPLLRRGLVVIDTPGLNAIGAEPELTLSLLPTAHAVVFVLGADTGVTKSDLAIWRDHLASPAMTRYVVLNKIDGLADPLLSEAQVEAQIEAQRQAAAAMLELPAERVFPLSARQALTARVEGHARQVAESRLPALEEALAAQLLPQRRQVLAKLVSDGADALQNHAARRLGDLRRQAAEQMLELRGLRGKSGSKVQLMLARVDRESEEFESCTTRLAALRSVHARMLREMLLGLSSDKLRDEVAQMQREVDGTLFNLGAKKGFVALCARLRALLARAQARGEEIHEMLGASYKQLNAEYAFGLMVMRAPTLQRYVHELELIERSYGQYLGLSHALRLSEPRFMEQFRRMLLSKLRVAFENASSEIELWNRSATAQVDSQLRERRRGFRRRREALERIQLAAGELEQRIAELQLQDQRWQHLLARTQVLADELRTAAAHQPEPDSAMPPLSTEREPPTLTLVASRAEAVLAASNA